MKNTLLALALLTAANAHANLIVNGNFDQDGGGLATKDFAHVTHPASPSTTLPSGVAVSSTNPFVNIVTLNASDATAFAWKPTNAIDPFVELSKAPVGSNTGNYVELHPSQSNGITQVVSSITAGTYDLSWSDMTRGCSLTSPGCVPEDYSVTITGGTFLSGNSSVVSTETFTTTNDWRSLSRVLNLTGDPFTITFADIAGGTANQGALLDTVSLTAQATVAAPVPEPETYAMFLAGLGLLGFARRRQTS